jgi:ankyrin repeat protein
MKKLYPYRSSPSVHYNKFNEGVRSLMTGISREDYTKKKQELIDYIKDIVEKNGECITMGDIEAESSPVYKHTIGVGQQDLIHLIETLYPTRAKVEIYDNWNEDILDSYTVPYEFLSPDTLIEIKELLQDGIEYKHINESLRDKMTPKTHEDISKALSKKHPNDKLYIGVTENQPWLVKQSLEEGATVHLTDHSDLFLHAVKSEYYEIVSLLVQYGSIVQQALSQAVRDGQFGMVKFLVKNGANPTASPSLLTNACYWGHTNIVQYLLAHGADVHNDDDNALYMAVAGGYPSVVEILLKHGANPRGHGDEIIGRSKYDGQRGMTRLLQRYDKTNEDVDNTVGNTSVRSMMTPRTGLDDIVDKYLYKYPQLGTFDYTKYGWTVDFDKSTFDEPHSSESIHIVFRDRDDKEWVMYIEPDTTSRPVQIHLIVGRDNGTKGINFKFQSYESLITKLEQLGILSETSLKSMALPGFSPPQRGGRDAAKRGSHKNACQKNDTILQVNEQLSYFEKMPLQKFSTFHIGENAKLTPFEKMPLQKFSDFTMFQESIRDLMTPKSKDDLLYLFSELLDREYFGLLVDFESKSPIFHNLNLITKSLGKSTDLNITNYDEDDFWKINSLFSVLTEGVEHDDVKVGGNTPINGVWELYPTLKVMGFRMNNIILSWIFNKPFIKDFILERLSSNESIKDLMTPITPELITKNLGNISSTKLTNYIIESIKKNDTVLLDLLLKHKKTEELSDHYKYYIIKIANDYGNLSVITYFLESGLSTKLLEDIYGYALRQHREKVTKLIEPYIEDVPKEDKSKGYMTMNESLRDKMTPKSVEDISSSIHSWTLLELYMYWLDDIFYVSDDIDGYVEHRNMTFTIIYNEFKRRYHEASFFEKRKIKSWIKNLESSKFFKENKNNLKLDESVRDTNGIGLPAKVSEGLLRSKMTPKSDEDITKSLGKLYGYQLVNYIADLIHKNDKDSLEMVLKHMNKKMLSEADIYYLIELSIDSANLHVITYFLSSGLSTKLLKDIYGYTIRHHKQRITKLIEPHITANESVKDKMTPKSSEEIRDTLSGYTPNEQLMMGIRNGELWLVKTALMGGADLNFQDGSPFIWACINQQEDIMDYMIEKGVEVNNDVIRKIKSYGYSIPNWLLVRLKKYLKTNESVRDKMTGLSNKIDEYQTSFVYLIEQITVKFNVDVTYVERGLECDIYIEDKINIKTLIDWIKDNSNFTIRDYTKLKSGVKRITISSPKKTNESVRDKMTPKSFEDILVTIDSLDMSYEPYKNIIKTCAKMYDSVSLKRINDHSYRYTFKLDNLLYTVSCYHLSTFAIGTWKMRMTVTRNKKFSKDVIKDIHSLEDVMSIIGQGEKVLESVRDMMTPKLYDDKELDDMHKRSLLDGLWDDKLYKILTYQWMRGDKEKRKELENKYPRYMRGLDESVKSMMTPRSTEEIRSTLMVMLSSVMEESLNHFYKHCDNECLTDPMDLGETVAFYILDEIPIEEIYEEVYDRRTDSRTLVLNPHIKEIMGGLLIKSFPSWTKKDIGLFWDAFQEDKEIDFYK